MSIENRHFNIRGDLATPRRSIFRFSEQLAQQCLCGKTVMKPLEVGNE